MLDFHIINITNLRSGAKVSGEFLFYWFQILLSLLSKVLLLQKVTQGRQSLPDSVMDDYLGWQEIEEQLTKNYAYYCEINQLLSTEAPSEEDDHFSSCQKQLLFSLYVSCIPFNT